MTPATAAYRFLLSLLLGGCLGIFYGFLRIPGRRCRTLTDLVFAAAAFWVWLYHSFAVCRGDIRTVYFGGILAGILLWESAFGASLQPVFVGFWKLFAGFFRVLGAPLKKILYFAKILFASAEKWVTIVCTKLFSSQKKRGGVSHGRKKHSAEKCESGSSSRIRYP